MLALYRRFSSRFNLVKPRSPVPMSFYIELVLNCALLKTIWYSARFRGTVVVGRGSKIRVHPSARINLAPKSVLAIGIAHDEPQGAVLRLRSRSELRVEGRVQIMRACHIGVNPDAILTIGADTFFNEGSWVVCYSATTIGSGCAISWGVRIIDTDVHKLVRDNETMPHAPVHIGKDCWIGTNAIVLKGAQLGDGSVVAAGAVVTSKIPPRSLVAGVPARVVREDVTWIL
jgi:acetyltransferase-like isoleucine patch superfamily enzyme